MSINRNYFYFFGVFISKWPIKEVMNDLINRMLMTSIRKGETLDSIKKNIKRRYNVVIDNQALKERLRSINLNYQ
jgi:hypothetical protein